MQVISGFLAHRAAPALVALLGCWVGQGSWAQAQAPLEATPGGPVRLQAPAAGAGGAKANVPLPSAPRRAWLGDEMLDRQPTGDGGTGASRELVRRQPLSEFEAYATSLVQAGRPSKLPPLTRAGERDDADGGSPVIRRFGADLLWSFNAADAGNEANAVPDDYVLGPGDEVIVDLWGGVEANLRLKVSRTGALSIPRVGSVMVAGVRFGELAGLLRQRVAKSFRQFDLSVSMGELRTMRVLVTGFVQKPGAHWVSSLAGLPQVLASSGGPNAVGSYRQIQLRRNGQLVEQIDLYDLMLRGQSQADRRLQAGDVLHVPAVGPQVAVIGSVNNPAVFELRGEESVDDLLRMAGGLAPVANRERAVVLALGLSSPVRELDLAKELKSSLRAGEVLRIASLTDLTRPGMATQKRVRVEGEVARPGDYVLPAGAALADALAAAGGVTPDAHVFGTELRRESIRLQQVEGYDRALRELETEFNRAAVTRKEKAIPPQADGVPSSAGTWRLIERLRQVQPSGRVVLNIRPDSGQLPSLVLEDGDRLIVPGRQQAVSVYGSVFNGGSYQFAAGRTLGDYLAMAGGLTRGADAEGVFVLRADGSVVSSRQQPSGLWGKGGELASLKALPGDTLYIPEQLDKVRWSQELKDWAQILSQFGLGAVALKNLTQ